MKWNIKDWHANYYYNITAILQQQARVSISSVPILNFFQLICRIEIHSRCKTLSTGLHKEYEKKNP